MLATVTINGCQVSMEMLGTYQASMEMLGTYLTAGIHETVRY